MSIAYLLCEALKDISTENKLYHRTNIDAFVQIVKSKGLMGYPYGNRMAINKDHKEEIATGRKSTFTTVDNTKKYMDLSGSIGNIEIVLFTDRIKASIRSNKVTPIAEYNVMNKRELEEKLTPLIVPQHSMNIEKMVNALIKNREKLLDEHSVKQRDNIMKFVDTTFPNSVRKAVSPNKWELISGALFRYSTQSKISREGEERVNLPKDSKIPLDRELMRVIILPTFKIDFKDYANDFTGLQPLKDLLQAVKHPIVAKDPTQSRMINYIMKSIKILQEQGVDALLYHYGLSKEEIKDGNFKRNVSANL